MSRPSLADKDFLTVIETAEYFGLSRRKLFRLAEEKNLPYGNVRNSQVNH